MRACPAFSALAAIDAPLRPPIVEVEQHVGLARRIEQHLPGFLVAVLAAKPLDAVEAEAGVGLDRVRRKRVEQLAGVRRRACTTAMRAATFFCSSAGSSLATRSAAVGADLSSG